MKKFGILFLLFVIFVVSFFTATALFDAAAKANGFYKPGLEEDQGVFQ